MVPEDLRKSIKTVREFIANDEMRKDGMEDLQLKRLQLRAIEKTIQQLKSKNIPVPEGLDSGRDSLISKITEIEKSPGGLLWLYDELLDILGEVGSATGRNPGKDLYLRSKELKKQTTRGDILRKAIIAVLNEMGGSGHQRDVLKRIEEKLRGQFTPADLERPYGKSSRWESNTRKERNSMIKDGILTPESKRKKWTLAK